MGQMFLRSCLLIMSNIPFYKQATANINSVNSSKEIRLMFYLIPVCKERLNTKENLNLAPVKREAIIFNLSVKKTILLKIQMQLLLQALVVTTISKPVKNQFLKGVQKHYNHMPYEYNIFHMADIQLADSNSTNSDI